MQRDSIDWGTTSVPLLFRKIFIPTLLGMLLASTLNLVDGAVVGQKVGSDGLAAVNIMSPLFLINTGIGLMFGSGVSIVAAMHLSGGRIKAANINITQAFSTALMLMVIVSGTVVIFPEQTVRFLGGSDRLMPFVLNYMKWVIPTLPLGLLMNIGLFVIRLDGRPTFAMLCSAIPALLNAGLKYLLVFPLDMGIYGASMATGIAQITGGFMVVMYVLFFTKTIHLYKPKFSIKAICLTLRNISYQVRLGIPSMIGELAIACMMFTGNYVFMTHLGEEGVAAFSVACYCFPLIFMVGNSIAQSAQPSISYNHGAGFSLRVRKTFQLSIIVAFICGILSMFGGILGSHSIVSIFIPAKGMANSIAMYGLPYFSISFLFFTLNLVFIGYFQSLERFKAATGFMLLRGLIFIVPAFIVLPNCFGTIGLWLAVPISELTTFIVILSFCIWRIPFRSHCEVATF